MDAVVLGVVIIGALIVIVLVSTGLMSKTLATSPKSFGLEAFEAHGLDRASADVVKAVVATISFLGHPFTVIEEAEEAKADAVTRSERALARVRENLEEIQGLLADNNGLESQARWANTRAGALDALVAQVGAVVVGS